MPLYEYECLKCHARTERIENFSGPHLKKCPKCKGRVERMISPPAIQFKGSGWYVTDYAKSSAAATAGEGNKTDAPAASGAAEKSASDAKSKPAAKAGKKTGGEK